MTRTHVLCKRSMRTRATLIVDFRDRKPGGRYPGEPQDHSCHPRSGRHRYSVDSNAGSRDSGWLALSHQRNRRLDHHLLDGQSAGFLVVARLGDPWNCGRYHAPVAAPAGDYGIQGDCTRPKIFSRRRSADRSLLPWSCQRFRAWPRPYDCSLHKRLRKHGN